MKRIIAMKRRINRTLAGRDNNELLDLKFESSNSSRFDSLWLQTNPEPGEQMRTYLVIVNFFRYEVEQPKEQTVSGASKQTNKKEVDHRSPVATTTAALCGRRFQLAALDSMAPGLSKRAVASLEPTSSLNRQLASNEQLSANHNALQQGKQFAAMINRRPMC